MRILSLSTQVDPCGIGDVNAALQSAMRSQGHTYDVYRITPGMRAAHSLAAYEHYLEAVEQYDATLIQHEFGFFSSDLTKSMLIFSALLKRLEKIGKPSLTVLHSNIWQKPANRPLEWRSGQQKLRRAIKSFVAVLNNSSHARFAVHGEPSRAAVARVGLKPSKTTTIHLAMREVVPQPVHVRGPDDRVTLGIFGFIADYKGYRNALEAMLFLPERFHLRIVGGKNPRAIHDPTLNRILGMIHTGRWTDRPLENPSEATACLRERVTITGFVPDITQALSEIDIVLAPYTEHCPPGSAALTNSLSHGKPIVASATPSFADIVKDGDCLKLVPLNAPFELAKVVADLATDHAELQRLSAAALDFARRNSWEACAKHFVATLTEVANSRSVPSGGSWPSWN